VVNFGVKIKINPVLFSGKHGTKPAFLRILTRGQQLASFTMPDSALSLCYKIILRLWRHQNL